MDPTWRGKPFQTLSNGDYEEIAWELAELNFRFELLALDSRLNTDKESISGHPSRQELVEACFADGSLLVADLSSANQGLANPSWKGRAPYLHALKRLMMTWRGDANKPLPSLITTEKVRWTEDELLDLEKCIAQLYVTSFHQQFHRAAVIPRRLSHQVPIGSTLAQTPTPTPPAVSTRVKRPEVTILNEHPNVFYDVSLLDNNTE